MDISVEVIIPRDEILTFMHVGTDESGLPSVEILKNNLNQLIDYLNEESPQANIQEITSHDILSYFQGTPDGHDITDANSILNYDKVKDYLRFFFTDVITSVDTHEEKENLKYLIETRFNDLFRTGPQQQNNPNVEQQNNPNVEQNNENVELQNQTYEYCIYCHEDLNDNATVIKCSTRNCNVWYHYDPYRGCPGARARICEDHNPATRICPACRQPWGFGCPNNIIRQGPVLTDSVNGGDKRKYKKTKTRKTRKTRRTKRKTRKTKTRRSKTRRTKKY